MLLSKLPRELSLKIFLMLDGVSLHTARQACKDWNEFIIQQIWGSRQGRNALERKLKNNWNHGIPSETQVKLSMESKPHLLGMSEKYVAVKILRESSRRVTRSQKGLPASYHWVMVIINMQNRKRQEIMLDQSLCSHLCPAPNVRVDYIDFGRAFIHSSTVICELQSEFGFILGIAAWNIENQQRLLCKQYPSDFSYSPQFDFNTGEILLNSKLDSSPSILRLALDDNQVTETFFETKDIGSVAAFCSPYLLCNDPTLKNTVNLCKIVENKVEMIAMIETPDIDYLRDKFVMLNSFTVRVNFRTGRKPTIFIWRTVTGEFIKTRPLPLPVPLDSVFPDIHGIGQDSKHLVLRLVRKADIKHLVLVYDIERLATVSGPKAKKLVPRYFIAENSREFSHSLASAKLVSSKTNLLMTDVIGDQLNYFSWNFWKERRNRKKHRAI